MGWRLLWKSEDERGYASAGGLKRRTHPIGSGIQTTRQMKTVNTRYRKPAITIGQSEHARLTRMAEGLVMRSPDIADQLLQELERARIVADASLRPDVVRMGSSLRYVADTGEERTVSLVYPVDANIEAGRISILTPIGTALLGLSSGQSIEWEARDGRTHRLTVEEVAPLAGEGPKSQP